jgi:hypothetical protein
MVPSLLENGWVAQPDKASEKTRADRASRGRGRGRGNIMERSLNQAESDR